VGEKGKCLPEVLITIWRSSGRSLTLCLENDLDTTPCGVGEIAAPLKT